MKVLLDFFYCYKKARVNANFVSCTIENARTIRNSYTTNDSYYKKLLRNYQKLLKYY